MNSTEQPFQPQKQSKFSIKNIFAPDYEHYEGIRKINIYLLRLLFTLMFLFLTYEFWGHILNHTTHGIMRMQQLDAGKKTKQSFEELNLKRLKVFNRKTNLNLIPKPGQSIGNVSSHNIPNRIQHKIRKLRIFNYYKFRRK